MSEGVCPMTRSEPHPQRCETCKHRLPDCDKEDLCSRICKKIFLEDPRALQIGIPYFIDIVGCASHSSASGPAPEPNPCEENGCTDIENCDEICEHMRIYSPAYVRESRQKARAEVLDELAEPTIRASEEAEQNGDYVSQTCYEDVLKWIAAIRQQEQP